MGGGRLLTRRSRTRSITSAVWLNRHAFFVQRGRRSPASSSASPSALLRAWSTENDGRPSPALVRRMRRLAGGGLPVVVLTLTWASFDWSMSLQHRLVLHDVRLLLHRRRVRRSHRAGLRDDGDDPAAPDGPIGRGGPLAAPVARPRASARAPPLRDGGLLGLHRVRPVPHLLDGRHPRRGELLRATDRRVVERGDVPHRVRTLRRPVLPAPQPATQAPSRRPGGRGRLGLRDAVRRRVLAGAARTRRDGRAAALARPRTAALFVGGLACAWTVRRYATAAPPPLHVPELGEGLGYEAAL